MEMSGVEKLTEMHFTDAIIEFLRVMKTFDGAVVPEVGEMF
jgi:hypothetical protein